MTLKRLSKRSLISEMDRNVKQMLKLIEDDGDSFAKKAEMYYQKRPEMMSLVEDFYRGYRSLVERYDHVTAGEWSKNIPSDLQSQASGVSDNGSEPSSTLPSASPRKLGRRISSNRAAGFDFFLGWGGDGSSTLTDSDDESDDASSINSYSGFYGNNGGDHGMNRRIMDLEIELREVKEKLWMHEEEGSSRGTTRIDNGEDFRARINAYEQELRIVNQKLRFSEEEITKLNIELEKYKSMESPNLHDGIEEEDFKKRGEALDKEIVESFREELRITKEKLESSEMQIASMKFEAGKSSESIQHFQEQLNLAQRDIVAWETKFNSEKRESNKLQERLEHKIFLEKTQLKSEMSKLLEEHTHLEDQIREWECHGLSLEEEIREIHSEKIQIEETLKVEIEQLKEENKEGRNNIKDLNVSLEALKLERDNLIAEVGSHKEEVILRDNQIEQLDIHLKQLHMEHVQLIYGMEEAHTQVEELKSRTIKLEEEIERQKNEIIEGAEEKREAIRQLCFSLEHYRNGYNVLRQAFTGHKRFPVLASKIHA